MSQAAVLQSNPQSNLTGSGLMEVLKKRMRVMKEELDAALELADSYKIRVADETKRREEVSGSLRSWPPDGHDLLLC